MARKLKGTAIQAGTISVTQLDNSVSTVIQTGGGPKISNIQVTDNSWTVLDDTAVDIAGGYILISGTGFVSGALVYFNQTPATSVAFVSSTALRVTVPAFAAGTYVVYVINPDGGSAIRVPGITASTNPAWQTGSSLGEIGDSVLINLSLIASDAVSYTVISGSLPPGLSLNSSTGVISGTVTGVSVETVYTFTVRATDAQNQDSPRTFTVTVSVNDPYFKLISLLISGEQGNSILRDSSVNNFNLTVFGDARASNFTPYSTGWSTFLDGTGDYLTTASNAALGFGTGDFTIEGWFYFTGTIGTYQRPWGFNDANDNIEIFNSVLRFGGTNQGTLISGSTTIQRLTWYHIAVTRASGVYRLWLNGQAEGGTATNSWNSSSRQMGIGAYPTGVDPITGYISNLRLVKGVAIYTGVFTPPTQPLATTQSTSANIAAITGTQTSLLTSCSNRLVDISSNSIAITRNGDAKVVSFNPFNITNTGVNGSMYFDGTGDYVTVPSSANLGIGASDYTVEGWFYTTDVSALRCIVTYGSGTFRIFFNGSNIWFLDGGSPIFQPTGVIVPYLWNHMAIVRSGSGTNNTACFLNGTRVAQATNTSNFSTAVLTIGTEGGGSYYIGYMSNLRIVKGTALYDPSLTTYTVPTAPLTAVANTQLLTLQYDQPPNNHTFLDSSSNQFVITRNGNATQGTFSPFSPSGWSIYLNGSSTFTAPTALQTAFAGWGGRTRTFEVWIYRDSATDYSLQTAYAAVADGSRWYITISSNKLRFGWLIDGGSTEDAVSTTATIPLGWVHLSVTNNATTASNATVYLGINGTVETFTGKNFSTHTAASTRVWNDLFGYTQYMPATFKGYFTGLRWSNNLRYTSNYTVPSSLFVSDANTLFLLGQQNRFIDESSSAIAIAVSTGTPTVTAFSPYSSTAVYNPITHGGSVYLDGTGDYLTSPTGNPLLNTSLDILGSDYTIELWFYPQTSNPDTTILTNFTSSGGNGWTFGTRLGAISLTHWVNNANTEKLSAARSFPAGQWYHLAVTRFNSNYFFYINGVDSGMYSGYTRTPPTNGGAGTGLGVGAYIQNLTYAAYTQGYVSGIRIARGAVYTANFTPATSPPVSTTNTQLLLNFTDAAILDRSSRNVIETQADAKVSSVQVKYGTGSMWFDGTGDILAIPDSRIFDLVNLDWTIEFWMYRTVNATQVIIVKRANNTALGMPLIYANTSSQIQVDFSGQTGLTSTTTVSLNSWVHIAVVRSGSGSNNVKIYFNGVADATTVSWTALSTNSSPLYIGGDSNGNNFTGYLSDLRITRGYARYTNNFSPPSSAFKLK